MKLSERITKVNQDLFKHAYVKRNNKWLPADKRPKSISTARQYEFFRKEFGIEYGIDTKIALSNEHCIVMKSEIADATGRIIATGYSTQYWGEGNEVAKAETYSKSRALSNFGLIDGDITSYEEYLDVGVEMEEVKEDTSQNNESINPNFVIKKYKLAKTLDELNNLEKSYKEFETKLLKERHLLRLYRQVTDARETRRNTLEGANNER